MLNHQSTNQVSNKNVNRKLQITEKCNIFSTKKPGTYLSVVRGLKVVLIRAAPGFFSGDEDLDFFATCRTYNGPFSSKGVQLHLLHTRSAAVLM